jgi:hypothetical protein
VRLKPEVNNNKTPLPPLEDLAEAVTVLLQAGLQHNKEPRKELEHIFQAEGATKEWFPELHGQCTRDMRINSYLGAGGVMTPGRIQDPEGANTVIISFKTSVDFVRRIPALFRLVPYTPVPSTAIAASGFRRLRPTVYDLLTSLIEG